LFSLISGLNVRKDSAVTGEVTLTGKVLAVGGIKEKVLAAHRNKIYRIILPKANRKDVEDIDANIRKSLQIEFVDNVHELIQKMINGPEAVVSISSPESSEPMSKL
jgi:ATP-dependent Lon protease